MRQPIKVSTSFPGKPPPPQLLNFWEYPTQLPGFDGNTFLKSKSTTVTIYLPNFKIQTFQTFLLRILSLLPLGTFILKDTCIPQKDLTLPVQISHHNLTRFKFPLPDTDDSQILVVFPGSGEE